MKLYIPPSFPYARIIVTARLKPPSRAPSATSTPASLLASLSGYANSAAPLTNNPRDANAYFAALALAAALDIAPHRHMDPNWRQIARA